MCIWDITPSESHGAQNLNQVTEQYGLCDVTIKLWVGALFTYATVGWDIYFSFLINMDLSIH